MALLTTGVKAEEEATLNITFDGDSQKFIQWDVDPNTFTDMSPDETRTQVIKLTNNDHREMKYYMKAQFTNELGKDLVYDVTMRSNGEIYFEGKIGGPEHFGMEGFMEEDFLLATLKEGESATIEMDLKIDGTSMDNTYQGTVGAMSFAFSVQYDDPIVEKEIIQVFKDIVDTGDSTTTGLLVGLVAVSGLVLVLFALKKKKGEAGNEN